MQKYTGTFAYPSVHEPPGNYAVYRFFSTMTTFPSLSHAKSLLHPHLLILPTSPPPPQGSRVLNLNVNVIHMSYNWLFPHNLAFPVERDPVRNQMWTSEQCTLASEGNLVTDVVQLQTIVSLFLCLTRKLLNIITSSATFILKAAKKRTVIFASRQKP